MSPLPYLCVAPQASHTQGRKSSEKRGGAREPLRQLESPKRALLPAGLNVNFPPSLVTGHHDGPAKPIGTIGRATRPTIVRFTFLRGNAAPVK